MVTPEVKDTLDLAEARDLLKRSIEDVQTLRAQINCLSPKAEAYDTIVKILRMVPGQSQGYGEDIVWRIQKFLEETKRDGMG